MYVFDSQYKVYKNFVLSFFSTLIRGNKLSVAKFIKFSFYHNKTKRCSICGRRVYELVRLCIYVFKQQLLDSRPSFSFFYCSTKSNLWYFSLKNTRDLSNKADLRNGIALVFVYFLIEGRLFCSAIQRFVFIETKLLLSG